MTDEKACYCVPVHNVVFLVHGTYPATSSKKRQIMKNFLPLAASACLLFVAACSEQTQPRPEPVPTPTGFQNLAPLPYTPPEPTIVASGYDEKESVTWRRWSDDRVEYAVPGLPYMTTVGGVPGMWVSRETLDTLLRKESEYRVGEMLRKSQERMYCINFPENCRDRDPYR